MKQRYVVNLEFDGFFVDDDLSITFDGKTSASFYKVGTRDAPCIVEVYAKSTLTNYTIAGLGVENVRKSSRQRQALRYQFPVDCNADIYRVLFCFYPCEIFLSPSWCSDFLLIPVIAGVSYEFIRLAVRDALFKDTGKISL